MQMQVVPTIEVKASATLDALQTESGLDGNTTRRRITH
jgi:hypothetical protein